MNATRALDRIAMFRKLLCVLVGVAAAQEVRGGSSAPGVQCVSDIAFTLIAEVFNNPVDIGVRLYCPQGHHCVSNSESPCHPNYVSPPSTTTTSTTDRPTTTGGPKNVTDEAIAFLGDINCDGPGYYRASKCNEYYECAPLYWWFKANLATCKEGYFYSETNRPCSMPPNVVCTDAE